MKNQIKTIVFLLILFCVCQESKAYRYIKTLTFDSSVDILAITANNTNLSVLNNSTVQDQIQQYNINGTRLDSFGTGTIYTTCLAWNGNSYVFSTYLNDRYKINEASLSRTITGPYYDFGPHNYLCSLGYHNGNLYTAKFNSLSGIDLDVINATNYTYTGTIHINYPLNGNIIGPINGLAWYGDNLFIGFSATNKVIQFDSNLNLIDEFNFNIDVLQGITVIGDYLYVADRRNGSPEDYSHVRIYEIPEPATLLLLGLGALVIRKRRNV